MRVIRCLGQHVCPHCKGTGELGNLVKRRCERGHIEASECTMKDIYRVSWPPSNNLVQYQLLNCEKPETGVWSWSEQVHHNWTIIEEYHPTWTHTPNGWSSTPV